MKKKKIIALSLTLTMVLSTVFAGTSTVLASSNTGDELGTIAKTTNLLNAKTSVTLDEQITEPEPEPEPEPFITAQDFNSTTSNNLQTYNAKYSYVTPYVIAVDVKKAGAVIVNYNSENVPTDSYIKMTKDKDINSKSFGSSQCITEDDNEGEFVTTVSEAGRYYLHFTSVEDPISPDGIIKYSVQYAPAGGTPKLGTTYYGSSPSKSISYYKVTAPSTGYFTVSFPESTSLKSNYSVQICNSKKTSLVGTTYETVGYDARSYTRFGATKGTYYIAVKGNAKAYGIKVSFTKVTPSTRGTSKTKAVSLSKTKTKKGLLSAGSTGSDWYKLKITKSQTVKLYITAKTGNGSSNSNGGIKVYVYKGSRSITSVFNQSRTSGTIWPYSIKSSKKLSAGTYYIKVARYAYGSGYYTLKWK